MRKQRKMKCGNVQKKLSSYQDGELGAEEQDHIKAHITDCPECGKQYESYLHIWNILGDLPDIQPGPVFNMKLRKRISGANRGRFVLRLRPIFQNLPSPLAMGTLLLLGIVMGIYLGKVLFEEDIISFQNRQPRYVQEHVSLASLRTFDTVPPGTFAHGYLTMVNYQEEVRR